MIDAIRAVKDSPSPSPLMVIGHNPSLEGAALALGRAGLSLVRDRIATKYPTAGLAVIDFAADHWSTIEPGTGEMVSFTTPRDLGV